MIVLVSLCIDYDLKPILSNHIFERLTARGVYESLFIRKSCMKSCQVQKMAVSKLTRIILVDGPVPYKTLRKVSYLKNGLTYEKGHFSVHFEKL